MIKLPDGCNSYKIEYTISTVSGKEYSCSTIVEFPAIFKMNTNKLHDDYYTLYEKLHSILFHTSNDNNMTTIIKSAVESITVLTVIRL